MQPASTPYSAAFSFEPSASNPGDHHHVRVDIAWNLRVQAYVLLLVGEYPPGALD